MMNELEFAQERYRLFLKLMPLLVEEAKAKAKTEAQAQEFIDILLDDILKYRREIKRLKNG